MFSSRSHSHLDVYVGDDGLARLSRSFARRVRELVCAEAKSSEDVFQSSQGGPHGPSRLVAGTLQTRPPASTSVPTPSPFSFLTSALHDTMSPPPRYPWHFSHPLSRATRPRPMSSKCGPLAHASDPLDPHDPPSDRSLLLLTPPPNPSSPSTPAPIDPPARRLSAIIADNASAPFDVGGLEAMEHDLLYDPTNPEPASGNELVRLAAFGRYFATQDNPATVPAPSASTNPVPVRAASSLDKPFISTVTLSQVDIPPSYETSAVTADSSLSLSLSEHTITTASVGLPAVTPSLTSASTIDTSSSEPLNPQHSITVSSSTIEQRPVSPISSLLPPNSIPSPSSPRLADRIESPCSSRPRHATLRSTSPSTISDNSVDASKRPTKPSPKQRTARLRALSRASDHSDQSTGRPHQRPGLRFSRSTRPSSISGVSQHTTSPPVNRSKRITVNVSPVTPKPTTSSRRWVSTASTSKHNDASRASRAASSSARSRLKLDPSARAPDRAIVPSSSTASKRMASRRRSVSSGMTNRASPGLGPSRTVTPGGRPVRRSLGPGDMPKVTSGAAQRDASRTTASRKVVFSAKSTDGEHRTGLGRESTREGRSVKVGVKIENGTRVQQTGSEAGKDGNRSPQENVVITSSGVNRVIQALETALDEAQVISADRGVESIEGVKQEDVARRRVRLIVPEDVAISTGRPGGRGRRATLGAEIEIGRPQPVQTDRRRSAGTGAKNCGRVTVPKPFRLTGESLQERTQAAIEESRRKKEEVESRRRVFRAKPMPDFSKAHYPKPKKAG